MIMFGDIVQSLHILCIYIYINIMCLARGISPGADAATLAVGSAWGDPRKKLQIGSILG